MKIQVNGQWFEVQTGMGLAAALYALNQFSFRKSESGEPRGALCGMGICFECRVRVDGQPNRRSCMIMARDGMKVQTE